MQVSSGAFGEFGFSHCLDVKSRQVQVITPPGTELSSAKKTPGRNVLRVTPGRVNSGSESSRAHDRHLAFIGFRPRDHHFLQPHDQSEQP